MLLWVIDFVQVVPEFFIFVNFTPTPFWRSNALLRFTFLDCSCWFSTLDSDMLLDLCAFGRDATTFLSKCFFTRIVRMEVGKEGGWVTMLSLSVGIVAL